MDKRLEKAKDVVKVSIVVPVYNVSEYIERCIYSVICQTYPNIECIIVDDDTSDDSIVKCEKIINAYSGKIDFKILHHEKNRGLSAARNTGTDASTGEYLFYLDSDDEITPDCISLMMEAVAKYPDTEVVQGGVKSVPDMSIYDISFLKDIDYKDDNVWVRKNFYTLNKSLPVNAWNKLVRKDFLTNYSLSFKEGLIHEDVLWMFFLVKKASKIAIVHSETYIHYYGTIGSIMSTTTQKRTAAHVAKILLDVLQNLDEPCYNEQLLFYSHVVISFYDNTDSYSALIKKFRQHLKERRFFVVAFLLWCFKVSFPIVKGRLIHQLITRIVIKNYKRIK